MNWIRDAKNLLRELDPEARRVPLYVLSYDEVAGYDSRLCGAGCLAWTGPELDVMLRDYLAERGQWRGRGFATIVNRADCRDYWEAVGSVVHEFAHYILFGRSSAREPLLDPQIARTHLPDQWRFHESPDEGWRRGLPLWHGHGSRFVVGSSILAFRARSRMPAFGPERVGFGLHYYGPAYRETDFMEALRPLIAARGPVRMLAQAEPPEQFRRLYAMATGEQPADGWDPALRAPPTGYGSFLTGSPRALAGSWPRFFAHAPGHNSCM